MPHLLIASYRKFHAIIKALWIAPVNLEKAFNRVPKHVIGWALCKLGIEERLMHIILSMYENTRSRRCVGCSVSEHCSVKVGVHVGSCLSPVLSIKFLEPDSFAQDVPERNVYADDLVIISESLEEMQKKLILWESRIDLNFKLIRLLRIRLCPIIFWKINTIVNHN